MSAEDIIPLVVAGVGALGFKELFSLWIKNNQKSKKEKDDYERDRIKVLEKSNAELQKINTELSADKARLSERLLHVAKNRVKNH